MEVKLAKAAKDTLEVLQEALERGTRPSTLEDWAQHLGCGEILSKGQGSEDTPRAVPLESREQDDGG